MPALETLLWSGRSAQVNGHRIWDYPGLKLHSTNGMWTQMHMAHACRDDLLPFEVFMWAHAPEKLKKLTRLSAINIYELGTGSRPMSRLIALRAEYVSQPPRQLRESDVDGRRLPTFFTETFDIDGTSGECVTRVTEIAVGRHNGLLVHTNKGRSSTWVALDVVDVPRYGAQRFNRVDVGVVVIFGFEFGGCSTTSYWGLLTLPRDA